MNSLADNAWVTGGNNGFGRELRRIFAILALVLIGLSPIAHPLESAQAAQRFVVIGTGGVTGVYFPAGGALCRVINNQRKDHGIRCSVEATAGSVYNVGAVMDGDLDLAIVQSDVQYQAYRGEGPFKGKAHRDLRALFSLHEEAFTVVARAGSGIADLRDLEGKRVNIGNPGSGQRSVMETVMAGLGWTSASFAQASELTSRNQAQALCDGQVDAIVFMVGHPNASIREALFTCDSYLVPVDGPEVAAILASDRNFAAVTIDVGLYGRSGPPVKTFGGLATVVTSSATSDDEVYAMVRAVFTDLAGVKVQHDAFSRLRPEFMVADGLSAPLHRGAEKYYREVGLVRN